jgi:hypothetical protein
MEKDTLKRAGKAISSFCEGFFDTAGLGCCGLEVPAEDMKKLKKMRESAGKEKTEKQQP